MIQLDRVGEKMSKELKRTRTASSMYSQYINGNNSQDNKGHFESKKNFRVDLSGYSITKNRVTIGSTCKWDKKNSSGVPIDYDENTKTVYVDGSDAHTMLVGSTGSKKSRLVVMPTIHTLAAAGENIIICDPKGEIYKRTAGVLQKMSYEVHAINLREPQKGDGWNVLSIPFRHYCNNEIDKACEYINDMTINLIPIIAKDPYWDYCSRDLFFGLVMLLFKICREKNLPSNYVNISCVLQLKQELFFSTISGEIQNSTLWNYAKNDDVVRMRLNGIVICPEKTLSCIISTFDQHMSCFSLQPQVTEMLSESTFNVTDCGFKKKAIFMIMPDEKTTFHKIITIFLKQIYEILIVSAFNNTEDNHFPVRINFLLDEFSSLPTISDFPQMISASRSRNIRFILVVQSKHQLKQRYKEETNTIMSNCSNWMFLTSRETELLREISELSGTTGKTHEPLISISRLQHLDKERGECLIFNGRKYPYIALLPDIDMYDNKEYEVIKLPIRKEKAKINTSQKFFEGLLKRMDNTTTKDLDSHFDDNISHNNTFEGKKSEEQETVSDIQKELEAKFVELFGKIDNPNSDDSNNNS